MSDTPRTDAARPPYTELQEFVSAEFARKLERELNAANAIIRQQQLLEEENLRLQERIKMLEAVTNDPHALWINWLRGSVTLPEGIGDVREYQDRIKRLEEAGDKVIKAMRDEVANYCEWIALAHDAELGWNKAKEAKP